MTRPFWVEVGYQGTRCIISGLFAFVIWYALIGTMPDLFVGGAVGASLVYTFIKFD